MELKKPGSKFLEAKKTTKNQNTPQELPSPEVSPKKRTFSIKENPFKKLSAIFARHRTPFLITGGTLAVAAIAFSAFLVVSSLGDNQSKLTADLQSLGRDFYENYYYTQLTTAYDETKLKEFLEKYQTTGIKVNLENLSRYPSEALDNAALAQDFKNSKTETPCDTTSTKVTIYPQSPFSNTDYRLETELTCGFEN